MKLSEKKFQELKEKETSIEDLDAEYFIEILEDDDEIEADNILRLLNENICSFEKIVDKFKSIENTYNLPCLYELLKNKEFFEELIKNNRLNEDDLRYLLNTVDDEHKLESLYKNSSLTKYILNEFILNKELVDKFNTMIENDWWCKRLAIHTIFDYIEYENKNNEEILELNELNKKVYLLNSFDLNEDQKLELIEVLRNNEIVRNRVIQIVDNHVESNYDFDSLMNYLNKKEKRNLINI